jgi:hypothetical protein
MLDIGTRPFIALQVEWGDETKEETILQSYHL